MTHQELATSSKAFGVQGLLPGSRPSARLAWIVGHKCVSGRHNTRVSRISPGFPSVNEESLWTGDRYFVGAAAGGEITVTAASAFFNIASRAERSNSSPIKKTADIEVVLRMSVRGFAFSNTRSAILPGATDPKSFCLAINSAASQVADLSASAGVNPALTSNCSSSCRSKPAIVPGYDGESVPGRNLTLQPRVACNIRFLGEQQLHERRNLPRFILGQKLE